MERCTWAKDEFDIAYHDTEWGRPEFRDEKIFELLVLETMQTGLSWNIILKKRENMRLAFDGFDYHKIAGYGDEKKVELLSNAGIIRNRLKINAMIENAKVFQEVQKEYGSFAKYIWSFTDEKPVINHFIKQEEMPASSQLSDEMSKALKKKGFRFMGTVVCYSFMQAIGMLNDHLAGCPQYKECIAAFKNKKAGNKIPQTE